jgi:hypothetical protein
LESMSMKVLEGKSLKIHDLKRWLSKIRLRCSNTNASNSKQRR